MDDDRSWSAAAGGGAERRRACRRRVVVARVAILLVLGVGLAGCSPSGGAHASGPTTTTVPAGGSSTTTVPAGPTTTTVPAGAMAAVTLPVVACPTTVALATFTTVPLPPTVTALVPTDVSEVSSFAVFADTEDILRVVAPHAWTCQAQVAADGSAGMIVVPPGTVVPTSNQVLPVQGIVASATSACSLCTLGQACPFFPAALSILHATYPSQPCGRLSSQVRVVRTSATEVRFSAPAGVAVWSTGTGATSGGGPYPVQAVMTWSPSTHNGAYTSTCTLPVSSASMCDASVTAFAAAFPAG